MNLIIRHALRFRLHPWPSARGGIHEPTSGSTRSFSFGPKYARPGLAKPSSTSSNLLPPKEFSPGPARGLEASSVVGKLPAPPRPCIRAFAGKLPLGVLAITAGRGAPSVNVPSFASFLTLSALPEPLCVTMCQLLLTESLQAVNERIAHPRPDIK